MLNVAIFEGGECIDNTNHATVESWDKESLTKLVTEYFTLNLTDTVDWVDGDQYTVLDFMDIQASFMQMPKCPIDGGQIYVFKI